MTYRFELTAVVKVQAENVMQAVRAARRVRVIGERIGAHRSSKDRDMIRYAVEVESQSIVMKNEKGPG